MEKYKTTKNLNENETTCQSSTCIYYDYKSTGKPRCILYNKNIIGTSICRGYKLNEIKD
jgi:hypothetical protein